MGVDDFHVSAEHMAGTGKTATLVERTRTAQEQKAMDTYKKVESLAYKWFDGEIDDKRMAEAVFGLVNREVE